VEMRQENLDKSGSMNAILRAHQQEKPVYIVDPEGRLTSEDQRQSNTQTIKGVEDIDTIVRYLV
jgi:hypothetical protein